MKSNFDFLNKDQDTQILYNTAIDVEELYVAGKFSNEFESIRKIIENVAWQILDLNFIAIDDRSTFNDCLREIRYRKLIDQATLNLFYDLKNKGNIAAHTLINYSKDEALDGLHKLYDILVWFANSYMDANQASNKFFEPKEDVTYNTAERKLIYVQTANNDNGNWPAYKGLEKIGDASIDNFEIDAHANSEDLRTAANHRIKQYMGTAGVPYKLQWVELAWRNLDHTWFRDYDVHNVLLRSGIKRQNIGSSQEWFKTDLETAKLAIQAVKDNREAITAPRQDTKIQIILRPEQKEAVKKTKKTFRTKDKMLWNAKMRFGKTLSALELVKEEKFRHVLIMTHRPVVDEGWFKDFNKIGMPEAGYVYSSKNKGENFNTIKNDVKPFVYFASLQDLRGSKYVGGKFNKDKEIYDTDWDLVIIDEAHEGSQTDLAQNVIKLVVKENTKLLELSGTPFNLLDQYDEDQVYTWDYVMEQKAKKDWSKDHPSDPNPYVGQPRVSMYTFEMNKDDTNFLDEDKAFNFKEFFRVEDNGKFKYETKVRQFLDNITSPNSKNNYPFSTREFRNRLRHTLWILPGVKEANALENLMKKHQVFGSEYKIVNVVHNNKNDNDNGVTTQNDIDKVENAIGKDAAATKTITLTVRKMTTGVTIGPWTGVVFLSNTTSATQYLQAAFRAQSAYSSPTFGEKTNCYIFDFAPDRALTIMASATQLNTGVGKRNSKIQKAKMRELLNFLPIIGEQNQSMKPFKIDSLMAKLKHVYAEKAVRTGFDDESLYSDELLMLDNVALEEFKDLKAIVGVTGANSNLNKIDINHQGLTDEEYDQANQGAKKPKRERTPEELDAMEKIKELKKQRKTMISILRSISIRIPLMIYGMDVDIDEDVDINEFVKQVDPVSWEEFMPKGITKELFKKFSKYYDQDVFIEAGRIIRKRVKALDKVDLLERTEKLAEIFGTFRNPDKETVLTPWRVVNMQLGKTIGGYSFYDSNYQYTTKDGKSAVHWIDTEYTKKIFNQDSHILEINSKTGLYPLYVATSLYYLEYQKLNNDTAGKFGLDDELFIWQKILRENIFVIAKTPMAAAIAKRTLAGYRNMDMNVEYVKNIVQDAKDDVDAEAKKIERLFGNMKFDVVVGNPPYQETTNKKVTSGQQPVQNVFQYFQELSDSLGVEYSTLIYPGKRWIHQSGKGLRKFGYELINDPHLSKLVFYEDASMIFKEVDIADGISIVFKDYKKVSQKFCYEFIDKYGKTFSKSITSPGDKLLILNPKEMEISNKIDKFVHVNKLKYINESSVINRALFKIESDFVEKNPEKVYPFSSNDKLDFSKKIKLFTNDRSGKRGRAKWFVVDRKVITAHQSLIDEYQVVVSSANAGGQKRDNQIQIIDNHSAFGRSRVALKSFKTEEEAENFLKYAKSYFVRFAFLLTDESLSSLGKEVPDLLDYSNSNKFINYAIPLDNQIYNLLNLQNDDINYIENTVKNLRG